MLYIVLRRREMAEEMEYNELERKATALPGEEEEEIDISTRNRTYSNNQASSRMNVLGHCDKYRCSLV